jgi:trehalose/maltose hydrolase-like predicted phosphorylase
MPKIPFLGGLAILNGFAGMHPEDRVEGFARTPYPLGVDANLDGIWLSEALALVTFIDQRYDFSCGELTTRLRFMVNGLILHLEVVAFCSRSLPTVVAQEVQVRASQNCEISLRAVVDPTGIPGRLLIRETFTPGEASPVVDGSLRWASLGDVATCGVAYKSKLLGASDARRAINEHDVVAPLSTTYTVQARADQTVTLQQLTSLVPSVLHTEPDRQAVRLVHMAAERGFETLRGENREAWEDLWLGRLQLIGGDNRWQGIADAAFYYLHASTHPSSTSSTSLFGLADWTNYHYYRGHVMWDIESFAMPPLFLTNPPAALAMLKYRSDRLEAAAANAALMGYRGLQFPWESSPIDGQEAAPAAGTAAANESHVTLDVALAFAQYFYATGDRHFLAERAWPVLRGACEWLQSRTKRTERGYEILGVTGIAEKSPPVDNNAYTNLAAMSILNRTIELATLLEHQVPDAWHRIAKELFVPVDADHGYIRSHDNYQPLEEKGETPEPLAALFPFGCTVDSQLERNTLKLYLSMADKYAGAPMLSSMLGVWAAWLGDRDEASRLFEEGYAKFQFEPFAMTNEYRLDKFPEQVQAGPMFANLGGFLTGVLYGLTGLRLGAGDPNSWCARPVCMPSLWDGVAVERVWIRGKPMRLLARHGDERVCLEEVNAYCPG